MATIAVFLLGDEITDGFLEREDFVFGRVVGDGPKKFGMFNFFGEGVGKIGWADEIGATLNNINWNFDFVGII